MIKILFLVAFTVSVASAGGYGGSGRASGGYGGSYGGGGSISIGGRGGGGLGLSAGRGFTSGATLSAGEIIPAAISSVHRIEFKDVPLSRDIKAATIEVGASPIPINIIFKSASSNLNVLQQHEGGRGDTQETTSEDEPTRLLHTVTKPIVQEVREVITPFRKITQEIQPVQEEIQTIVARGTEIGRSTSLGGLALGGGSRALVEKTTKTLKNIDFDALVEKAELAAKGTGLGLGLVGKSASSYRARARA